MEAVTSVQERGGEHQAYLSLVVVALGTFMTAMAASAVNLALPSLGLELGIDLSSTHWVVSIFLLGISLTLLPAGRLGDLIGHPRVYLLGIVLFGVMSVLCALTGSQALLLLARTGQAIGAGFVMATGPALLTTTFPIEKRGQALGLLSAGTYIGSTFGPTAGGFLIQSFGWRSVFLINLPICLLVFAIGAMFFPRVNTPKKVVFDHQGTGLLLVGLPLLLLALSQGPHWGWAAAIGLAAGGFAIMSTFAVVEKRQSDPLIDLNLFKIRTFSSSTISASFNYMALFAPAILLPYALQEGLAMDPQEAGLLLSVQPIAMAIFAPTSGWLSDRVGPRGLAILGMLICAVGLGGLAFISPDSTTFSLAPWLFVMGAGTGIFISPNTSALLGSAPQRLQGVASGVMALARNIGMMLGIATAMLVFHAAGGQSGHAWADSDFGAMRMAMGSGMVIALLAAFAASLERNGEVGRRGSDS